MEDATSMGTALSAVLGIIGGVIAFVIVKRVIGAVTTTSWSSIEYTLIVTLVPVVVAVGALWKAMSVFNRGDRGGDKDL